jgi:FKBP-type peptidyl-prolyl cis-trans isomerase 2|tara:strand:+ start:13115 stop:13765 length:651 start_codon:yes stop_codon:yes gene_type:complete
MKTKKNDFIELDFVARLKETNKIFDLTDEKVAKENNIYDENFKYKPLIVCIGDSQVVHGLDKALEDKELNKDFKIELQPEEGFGKKNPKLFQLVNTSKFTKERITPYPGLQVNIDDMFGIVKTVSGGRTLVDFNHPLAGKEIIYEFKIIKIIKDDKEKLKSLLETNLKKDVDIKLEDKKATINEDIPKEIQDLLKEKIKSLIPTIKEINFKNSDKK